MHTISSLFCMLRRYLKFGCTSEKQSSCTRKPFKFHSAAYAVAFSALGRGFIRATYLVEQSLCHFLSFTLILLPWGHTPLLAPQNCRCLTESEWEILNSAMNWILAFLGLLLDSCWRSRVWKGIVYKLEKALMSQMQHWVRLKLTLDHSNFHSCTKQLQKALWPTENLASEGKMTSYLALHSKRWVTPAAWFGLCS